MTATADSREYMYPVAGRRVRTSPTGDPRFVLAQWEVWDLLFKDWRQEPPEIVPMMRGVEWFLRHRVAGWRGGETGSLDDRIGIGYRREEDKDE